MASGTSGTEEITRNDLDVLRTASPVSNPRATVFDRRPRSVETTRNELIAHHESRLIAARRKLHAKGTDVPYEIRERVRRHERFLDYLKGGE
jgi:hypothetical protein